MQQKIKNLLKKIKLNENTISTILGGIVVVVIGLLVFNYFQSIDKGKITDQAAQEQTTPIPGQPKIVEEEGKKVPQGLPTTYEVKEGDHLWKIAEDYYNSGYNWVDIAKVNDLNNPSQLAVGQELIIPKTEVKEPTVAMDKVNQEIDGPSIEGETYTVKEGDNLWEISVRAYGDGYQWTQIYQANKEIIGPNPGIIEPGWILSIPR